MARKAKKDEVYITHVLFPWETFAQQGERERREIENDGARWTEEFIAEVRKHIEEYAAIDTRSNSDPIKNHGNLALRNSLLNDVYKMVPFHFRDELFSGISFPIFD